MGGRRLFIQQLTVFAVAARANAVVWLQNGSSASVEDAMGLARTINTLESEFFANHKVYASKTEILGTSDLRGLMQRNTKLAWLQKLNLESKEILPGMMFDYSTKPDGYVFVISEKSSAPTSTRNVIISDQSAVIYRAMAVGGLPAASNLTNAAAFPGAVPHDQFRNPA